MALIPANLLLPSSYSVGPINFDLLIQESHGFRSTVTSHPVEVGGEITDHIQNSLRSGSLVGYVSDFSIQLGPIEGLRYPGGPSRYKDTYEALKALWKSRELVKIVTGLEVYESVAVTSISAERSSSNGHAQEYQISFQEVKVVQLKETALTVAVNVGAPTEALSQQASPSINAGRQVGVFGTANPLLMGAL